MYKLSEIAKRFKVEKKVLIKELIENKKILKNHIKKKNGLTYVNDKGIELLYDIFFENKEMKEEKNQSKDVEDIDKLKEKIKNYKLKILDLDSEIYQKNEILSEYQNKLIDINRKILNFNK